MDDNITSLQQAKYAFAKENNIEPCTMINAAFLVVHVERSELDKRMMCLKMRTVEVLLSEEEQCSLF